MAKGRIYFPRLGEKELAKQEAIALKKEKRKFDEMLAQKKAEQEARDAVEKFGLALEEIKDASVVESAETAALEAEI